MPTNCRPVPPVICSFLLTILGCQETPSPPTAVVAKEKSLQQQFIEDLNQYHDAIVEGWAYRASKQDVDVGATRDQLIAHVRPETTREEFAAILQHFAAALKDGHSQIETAHLRPLPAKTWPIGFVIVKEGIIVGNLNWLNDNPGVQLGDRLLSINGEQVEDVVRRTMAVTSASTDESRRVLAVDRLHWTDDDAVHFTIQRPNDELLEIDLQCLPGRIDYRFRERKSFCEFSELESAVGLIRMPHFTWNESEFVKAATDQEREKTLVEAKAQIDMAFASAENKEGLILDLRGNSGGLELLSSYVAEHLVEGDFLYYTTTRQNTPLVRSLDSYRGLGPEYFGTSQPQYPRRWTGFTHFEGRPYKGRLVVLINSRCFSTTDNLCAFLRDVRPDTRFIGQPTGAGTGEPMKVCTLKNSQVPIRFCVSQVHSPKGRLIEGTGTLPDVLIEPTRESLLQRRDPTMNAAENQFNEW